MKIVSNAFIHLACLAAIGLSSLAPGAADAQSAWKWRDEQGRLVYSDRPPAPGIRHTELTAISAGPARAAASAAADSVQTAAGARNPRDDAQSAPAGSAARERPGTESAQAEDRQASAEREVACEEARSTLRALESGVRVSVANAQGELVVIDDAERQRRIGSIRQTLSQRCAPGAG